VPLAGVALGFPGRPGRGLNAHGAYFDEPQTLDLMRQLLRGVDRNVLTAGKRLLSSAPPNA
jgi:hypothetical protein